MARLDPFMCRQYVYYIIIYVNYIERVHKCHMLNEKSQQLPSPICVWSHPQQVKIPQWASPTLLVPKVSIKQ